MRRAQPGGRVSVRLHVGFPIVEIPDVSPLAARAIEQAGTSLRLRDLLETEHVAPRSGEARALVDLLCRLVGLRALRLVPARDGSA